MTLHAHHQENGIDAAVAAGAAALDRFFAHHHARAPPPVYSSCDVRRDGYRTVQVDTNAFPAGFNNLCPSDHLTAATALRAFADAHLPPDRPILLYPEDHTRNPFYLQNIDHLSIILRDAGIAHTVGSANAEVVAGIRDTPTPEGRTLEYAAVARSGKQLLANDAPVAAVLSNNDFTTGVPAVLAGIDIPVLPPPQLGWDHRSKAKHFVLYKHLANQAAQLLDIDPYRITIETRTVENVDFKAKKGLDTLADAVDAVIDTARERARAHGRPAPDRVFLKDDAGTYGMGILPVSDGNAVRRLNNPQRMKMDRGKYGHKITRVIVQEAVATVDRVEGHTAEPVLYVAGGVPIGAFFRMHDDKGDLDNLNQPGMHFLPACRVRGCHTVREHAPCLTPTELLIARLADLALAYEATGPVMAASDASTVPLPAPA